MQLSDKLLKVDGETCGKRIISSIHKIGDWYAFLDIGWAGDDVGSNPFHRIGRMISEEPEKWVFENKYGEKFTVTPITYEDTHWTGLPGSMLEDARNWQKELKAKGIDDQYIIDRIREMEHVSDNVDIY